MIPQSRNPTAAAVHEQIADVRVAVDDGVRSRHAKVPAIAHVSRCRSRRSRRTRRSADRDGARSRSAASGRRRCSTACETATHGASAARRAGSSKRTCISARSSRAPAAASAADPPRPVRHLARADAQILEQEREIPVVVGDGGVRDGNAERELGREVRVEAAPPAAPCRSR